MKPFNFNQISTDLKKSFLWSIILSLSAFAYLRIIFYNIPISFAEEGPGLLENVGVAWVTVFLVKSLLNLVPGMMEKVQKASPLKWLAARSGVAPVVAVLSLSMMLFACNIPRTGIHKDLNTGMVTKYTGIVPGETSMIMNGEELSHTEIPLGEKFTILNKHIEGLVVKDNKVSVGCSLKISDNKGQEIFYEPDLFKESGVFNENEVETLKCQVSTGRPMEWEKDYAVTVVFWDKFGKGKLENNLNITMQDVP